MPQASVTTRRDRPVFGGTRGGASCALILSLIDQRDPVKQRVLMALPHIFAAA